MQFIEKMMELLDLTTSKNCSSQGLRVLRIGQLKLGSASWQKEEDRRKSFSTAWTLILPNISCISEQSRDIQGVLLTMYCYRMTSTITSTTSGTLTTCTPSPRVDFSQPWTRCTPIKIRKKFNTTWINPESRHTKNIWRIHQNTVYWCNLKLAQRKGLQVLSHTIPRNRSCQNSTCDMYWESGFPEDSGGAVPQSISVSKVASCRTHAEFARTSADHQSERSAKYEETRRSRYEETRRGNVDYRIQGIPHSTDQKEVSNRKEIVKRLIQQFENHPNRDSLIEDLNKTEEFNPFSEKSKELITSMGNTEYFELC